MDPFNSGSIDYGTILLTWSKPAGTILGYRLLRNRYGYPANQDDGEILIDSADYPGSMYQDHDTIPGTYHYYGIYVLLDFEGDNWVRSGLTATLAIDDFASADWILSLVPAYFTNTSAFGDLTDSDDTGDPFVSQFSEILGWGLDQIKTQYETYLNVNDPWKVPLSSLYNLALEVGIDINPEISPYTLRKAIYFNATINEQRGSLAGINNELSALTGWSLDTRIGKNMLLENDQSYFPDPFYNAWSANLTYNVNEQVSFGSFFYKCISTGNYGHAPTGTSSSNTWWQAILGVGDDSVLLNTSTGYPNTWDVLYPSVSNGAALPNSLQEVIGIADPLATTVFTHNGLQVINAATSGSQNLWLRSIARTPDDLLTVTTTFQPDKYQVIADGIPVPFTRPSQTWDADTTYDTDEIVTYQNQPFIALRASTGVIPPYASIGSDAAEWAPVSWDSRLRICNSGYVTGSTAVAVTPFIEWYDDQGNFIMRLISRNQSSGTPVVPNNFIYDSFTTGAGNTVSGRTTDDGESNWTAQAGQFQLSPFAGGCAFPQAEGVRTYATVVGQANTNVGVTFLTTPDGGQTLGLILRWVSDNSYIRAGMTDLRTNNAGSWTTIGTYSTPFAAGDRMTVTLSGSSITVFRNGVSVLAATSTFNQTAVNYGVICENT